MSGPITHSNSFNRRQFVKHALITGAGLVAVGAGLGLKEWFSKPNQVRITSHNLDHIGHDLRKPFSDSISALWPL